jgi:hypothetical protein
MMRRGDARTAVGRSRTASPARLSLALVLLRPSARFAAIILFASGIASSTFLPGEVASPQDAPRGFVLVKEVLVAGNAAATDSGLDVRTDEVYYFWAEGSVSLQKDNPVATCGPEGLGLKTMQQPLSDQNLGALIGKIRERVEFSEDEQTGEKTQRDVGRYFFIGKSKTVAQLPPGRLLLGVNENVCGDNEGGFAVKIFLKRPGA